VILVINFIFYTCCRQCRSILLLSPLTTTHRIGRKQDVGLHW